VRASTSVFEQQRSCSSWSLRSGRARDPRKPTRRGPASSPPCWAI